MLNLRGRPASRSTYELVEAPLYCVVTRMEYRHAWLLPIAAWHHHRIARESRHITGLKRFAFLIESPRICFILSIWEGEEAYVTFMSQARSHLYAARSAFAGVVRDHGKPRIWSTEWAIRATSQNVAWGDDNDWVQLRCADRDKTRQDIPTGVPRGGEHGAVIHG